MLAVGASRVMYHVAPTEARPSIEQHGLDWRRLGLGGAYRPPGNYLWDSLEFALWYAQAYDDYDIWAVSVEGLELRPDPGFGEFADGLQHTWFSPQTIAAERLLATSVFFTPESVVKGVSDIAEFLMLESPTVASRRRRGKSEVEGMRPEEIERLIVELEDEMFTAAEELRFEYAAKLRHEIKELRRELLAVTA